MRLDVHRSEPTPTKRYRAFGLTVCSEIDLPELAPAGADADEADDIAIRRGEIGPPDPNARRLDEAVCVSESEVWLQTATGRFLAARGREITWEPAPGASDRDARLCLLGTMMGAVLHQRGLLPLHANAIALDRHAIALAGPSGAGKSTLAAHFHNRGRGVLSDDVCVIRFDPDGGAWIAPGLARLKLWRDTLDHVGGDADTLEPVADAMDKFSLPLARPPEAASPLGRLCILGPGQALEITEDRLTGPEAVNAVVSNVYRWPLAAAMGRAAHQFDQILKLTTACEIVSLRYPKGLAGLPALVRHLEAAGQSSCQ